jgi:hypothetical protein
LNKLISTTDESIAKENLLIAYQIANEISENEN